jgi:CubicO group peptidase (beta-lactamase class C family)
MKKAVFKSMVLLLIAGTAGAQTIIPQLDQYLAALHMNNELNGSILVAENGEVLYKKSFGYADFAGKIENTDTTLLNIASVSKTFTAIAVLQLKEKNKLRLDDTFIKYFPGFPYPGITIRQLLSHTSGLPDSEPILDSIIAKNPGKLFHNTDIIPALTIYKNSKQLPFDPGQGWRYSNAGYALLALLIEKVSKQSFADYMKKNVFIPAGMMHTYVQTSLSEKNDKNRAATYMYSNHFEMKLQQMDTLSHMKEWTYNLAGLTGSTNVISCTRDLLQYDKALYSSKLVKPATMEEAFTPVRVNGKENIAVQGLSYGLGWFVEKDSIRGKTVSHSGAAPGIVTYFIRNLSRKQTVIILMNVQASAFNISAVLDILDNKLVVYKKSAAFAYARDIYEKGPDNAFAGLLKNRGDTSQYVLTEKDMSRVGLEFGRTRCCQNYALEAYKINTLLFPQSWKVYDDYAAALARNGKKEEAEIMFRKSLSLNPENRNAIGFLKEVSGKKE